MYLVLHIGPVTGGHMQTPVHRTTEECGGLPLGGVGVDNYFSNANGDSSTVEVVCAAFLSNTPHMPRHNHSNGAGYRPARVCDIERRSICDGGNAQMHDMESRILQHANASAAAVAARLGSSIKQFDGFLFFESCDTDPQEQCDQQEEHAWATS